MSDGRARTRGSRWSPCCASRSTSSPDRTSLRRRRGLRLSELAGEPWISVEVGLAGGRRPAVARGADRDSPAGRPADQRLLGDRGAGGGRVGSPCCPATDGRPGRAAPAAPPARRGAGRAGGRGRAAHEHGAPAGRCRRSWSRCAPRPTHRCGHNSGGELDPPPENRLGQRLRLAGREMVPHEQMDDGDPPSTKVSRLRSAAKRRKLDRHGLPSPTAARAPRRKDHDCSGQSQRLRAPARLRPR